MVTVPATAITAAIRGITAAAMRRRITAAMPRPIMEGTARLTTATTMHRCLTVIDTVGLFVRRTPIMPAPGGIIGGTATIGTGELPRLREQNRPSLPPAR